MKNILIVAAMIECKDKYLFITQDKKGRAFPGCLMLVGGKIEPNETPEEAIKREVKEEVDIDLGEVKAFDFDSEITIYKGEETQLIALRYTTKVEDFYAKAGSDAKEVIWLNKEQILKYEQNIMTKRFLYKLGLINKEDI